MIKLKDILNEKKDILKEENMSPEQIKFAKPIFDAAAKKGKFKIKKLYMSFQPSAAIQAFSFGKDGGSMASVWGHALSKQAAMALGKAWEKADMDVQMSEFKPKFFIRPEDQYITLADAARFTGQKYDRAEYDRLFRGR